MFESKRTIRRLEEVVSVAGVHMAYRRGGADSVVLRGVDFSARRTECVFLAGPSGSGKSTLLSILGCMLTPDRGRVRILGQDVTRMDAAGRTLMRRHHIGFVFQRFQLIRGLTALDNVCLPLALRGASAVEQRRRAAELLEAVGLAEQAANDPRRLSVGQCQRVALARALAGDPDLILADEPTASLDETNGRQVIELLRRLVKEFQKAAVVVTHDARIFPYADRVCWLHDGRVSEASDESPTRADSAREELVFQ